MALLIAAAVVTVLRHGRFVRSRYMPINIVMAGLSVMMAAFGESLATGMGVHIVAVTMIAVIMVMLVVVRRLRHGRLGMVAAVIVMA